MMGALIVFSTLLDNILEMFISWWGWSEHVSILKMQVMTTNNIRLFYADYKSSVFHTYFALLSSSANSDTLTRLALKYLYLAVFLYPNFQKTLYVCMGILFLISINLTLAHLLLPSRL